MNYINPNIPLIESPTGLLAALQDIQVPLGEGLPWLEKSFGRAYLMPEKAAKGSATVPKVYAGKGEYYSVLPNDNLKSYSFLQVLSPEKTKDYEHTRQQNSFEAKVAIVFYLNLKKIEPATDHIFTDRLKNEALKVFKSRCSSFLLSEIQDESPRQVFEGYQTKDMDNALFMYPKAAFRFVGTLIYSESC